MGWIWSLIRFYIGQLRPQLLHIKISGHAICSKAQRINSTTSSNIGAKNTALSQSMFGMAFWLEYKFFYKHKSFNIMVLSPIQSISICSETVLIPRIIGFKFTTQVKGLKSSQDIIFHRIIPIFVRWLLPTKSKIGNRVQILCYVMHALNQYYCSISCHDCIRIRLASAWILWPDCYLTRCSNPVLDYRR